MPEDRGAGATAAAALRALPSVDALLVLVDKDAALRAIPRRRVVEAVREALAAERRRVIESGGAATVADAEALGHRVVARLAERGVFSLGRVINATGVVLHTNLGRALLSELAQERLLEVAGAYSNLEMDIATKERGSRYSHVQGLLHLCGVGEGITIGYLIRSRGINALGVLRTMHERTANLQRDRLEWHLPPALCHRLDPGLIRRQRPVGVGLIVKGLVVTSHRLLCASILGAARPVRRLVLPLVGSQEAVALAPPRVAVRLHTEKVVEEVLRRGILVQAAHQVGDGTVEILGLHHRGIE